MEPHNDKTSKVSVLDIFVIKSPFTCNPCCGCVCEKATEKKRERNMDKLNFITDLKLRYNLQKSSF